jgi:hypothetical protein
MANAVPPGICSGSVSNGPAVNSIRSGGPSGSAIVEGRVACTPERVGPSDGRVGNSMESSAWSERIAPAHGSSRTGRPRAWASSVIEVLIRIPSPAVSGGVDPRHRRADRDLRPKVPHCGGTVQNCNLDGVQLAPRMPAHPNGSIRTVPPIGETCVTRPIDGSRRRPAEHPAAQRTPSLPSIPRDPSTGDRSPPIESAVGGVAPVVLDRGLGTFEHVGRHSPGSWWAP